MTQPLPTLSSKKCLITGAARGLGASIAEIFAREGAVLGLIDRDKDTLEHCASALRKSGARVWASACDLTDAAATQVVEGLIADMAGVDVLVNNAGITRDAQLTKMTEQQWNEVIAVNLTSVFRVTQIVTPHLVALKSGSIINIASVARRGNFGQTNYSASKAGVDAMAKTWSVELARHGIRANSVAPGFIETAMTDAVPAEVKQKIIQRIPLRRMGRPQDIAETVAFLASDRASYITGQCITVDGGLTTGLSL